MYPSTSEDQNDQWASQTADHRPHRTSLSAVYASSKPHPVTNVWQFNMQSIKRFMFPLSAALHIVEANPLRLRFLRFYLLPVAHNSKMNTITKSYILNSAAPATQLRQHLRDIWKVQMVPQQRNKPDLKCPPTMYPHLSLTYIHDSWSTTQVTS